MGPILQRLLPGVQDQPIVQIELALAVLTPCLAFIVPFDRLAAAARRWMRHPARTLLLVSTLTLLLHAALTLREPLRAPFAHDEFSFLLAADTFLSGRLANPAHPLWPSFETPHVISSPTYSSMYPPAQGLLLAAGQLLGHPLLASAAGGAALGALAGWMLLAWVPRQWALFGALLVALRYGLFSYWATGYWGGIPGAAGGLLLFGAAPRWFRTGRAGFGCLAAAGLLLLASSRPFEGGLLILASLPILWPRLRKGGLPPLRSLALALLVLLGGACFGAYYNWRVTGSPVRLGYQINMERYGMAVFPWQSSQPLAQPAAPHLRKFYDSQHKWHALEFSLEGVIAVKIGAAGRFWAFFLGPLLTVPFFLGLRRTHGPWRFAFLVFAAGLCLNGWFFPHYLAPALGLFLLVLVDGLRQMSSWSPRARRAVWALPVALCAVVAVRLVAGPLHPSSLANAFELAWYLPPPSIWERASVERKLLQEPGNHLVLVRYTEDVSEHTEWVYNRASIEAARIVWAHDLDPESNRRLLAHYPSRRVWHAAVTPQGVQLE